MSISWGRRNRIRFEAAGELTRCAPPPGLPAVFAVTYKQDAANKPKSHTVLYFGECADLAQEVQSKGLEIKERWLNRGGKETELYVFYHPMPSSTMWQRASIQSQLVSEYDPPVNTDN